MAVGRRLAVRQVKVDRAQRRVECRSTAHLRTAPEPHSAMPKSSIPALRLITATARGNVTSNQLVSSQADYYHGSLLSGSQRFAVRACLLDASQLRLCRYVA